MKKINLLLVGTVMVFGMSCDLEESQFETVVSEGTIKGKVELDNDLTDGEEIFIPANGATVVITYDSNDLTYGGSNGVNVVKQIVVTTDGSGLFTATVPAIAENVTYDIKVFKFTTSFSNFDKNGTKQTVNGYYGEYNSSVSLVEGETEFIKITLDSPTQF